MSSATTDRFGAFGGRYVPETLIPALDELEAPLAAFGAPVAKDDVRGDACRSREVR